MHIQILATYLPFLKRWSEHKLPVMYCMRLDTHCHTVTQSHSHTHTHTHTHSDLHRSFINR